MTGIRRRISIAFLSIVGLLFASGMISFFELSHLSYDTEEILKANQRNVELAKEMLGAVHDQNVAIVHLAILQDASYDSLCRTGMQRLEHAVATAQKGALDRSALDSLTGATTELLVLTELRLLTDNYLAFGTAAPEVPGPVLPDSVGVKWYNDEYVALYGRLTSAIKNYMTSTQSSLAPRAEQLKKNAYRAVTPVLISLVVMIATVLMLFYFTMLYCVNPIVAMNKGLGQYLTFRIPFAVKAECKDEILELKEKIEALVAMLKQNKA